MINLVITESTTYDIVLPKGEITLYGTTFVDGTTTKTLTASGSYQLHIDVETYPNTSRVLEVWVGKARFQTIVVEYPDNQYIDPFYVKNSPHYVRKQDRVDTCPVLYSAGADLTTVTVSTKFTDLPTSAFNALDSQELLYERETNRLWWLTRIEPIAITRTEDWASDPIVNFFIYRDSLDNRYFIFIHASGLIRKLDTAYTEVQRAETGFKFIDASKFPDITTVSDFLTLDVDGNIRKYGIDLSLKLTTTLVGAIKLYADIYSKSATALVIAVTATGSAYTVSTTLLLTKAFGENVCGIAQRLNSGPTYMWAHDPIVGFHLVDSTGASAGSDYAKAFPLEFSYDATYLRATDGWSKVFVGQGQALRTLPDGSNPYLAFTSTSNKVFYVGRTRNKVPNYVVTDDWYRPQLAVIDFDWTAHTARIRVEGVNTELGLDLPESVDVNITDFYTGLPVTTLDQDTVLVLTGVTDTNLDSKFWMSVGKSEIEVELGGKFYRPDVTRYVGTVVNTIADSLELGWNQVLSATPEVESIQGTSPASVVFDPVQVAASPIPSSIKVPVLEVVGATAVVEVSAASAQAIAYNFQSVSANSAAAVMYIGQDVKASVPEASRLVSTFDIGLPDAEYEPMSNPPYIDQALAFDVGRRTYSELVWKPDLEAIPYPTNTIPNNKVSEWPRYLTYTSPLAAVFRKWAIDYWVDTSFSVDPQAVKVTAPLAAKWRTESEPYWIGTDFEYNPIITRYWIDTAFIQSTSMLVDRYWIGTEFRQLDLFTTYPVNCLPNYRTDSDPYPIDLVAQHKAHDYQEYITPVYENRKIYKYVEYDRGINTMMPAHTWYSHDLLPSVSTMPTAEIAVSPQINTLILSQIEIKPLVSEFTYPDIKLDAETFTVQFSTALAATALDVFAPPSTVLRSPYTVAIADLLSERKGVDAGYFLTEYAALQNAVNIWGMEPSAIFAKQLSTGFWVWLRTIECENTCDDSVCETFGYITGG